MKRKYLTKVTYTSGRVEILADANEKDMRERRKKLMAFPSVVKVESVTNEMAPHG